MRKKENMENAFFGCSVMTFFSRISINWCYLFWYSCKFSSLTGNGSSSTATASCLTSSTPFLAPPVASWLFDGSPSDWNNIYRGSYTKPPTIPHVTGNIGQAMDFGRARYIHSSTRFMNLSFKSWVVQGSDDIILKCLRIVPWWGDSCSMVLVVNAAFSISANRWISLADGRVSV